MHTTEIAPNRGASAGNFRLYQFCRRLLIEGTRRTNRSRGIRTSLAADASGAFNANGGGGVGGGVSRLGTMAASLAVGVLALTATAMLPADNALAQDTGIFDISVGNASLSADEIDQPANTNTGSGHLLLRPGVVSTAVFDITIIPADLIPPLGLVRHVSGVAADGITPLGGGVDAPGVNHTTRGPFRLIRDVTGFTLGTNTLTVVMEAGTGGAIRTFTFLVGVPPAPAPGPTLRTLEVGVVDVTGGVDATNVQRLTQVPGPLALFADGVYAYTSALSETDIMTVEDALGQGDPVLSYEAISTVGDDVVLVCRGGVRFASQESPLATGAGAHPGRNLPAPGQSADIDFYVVTADNIVTGNTVSNPSGTPPTINLGSNNPGTPRFRAGGPNVACSDAEAAASEDYLTKYAVRVDRAPAAANDSGLDSLSVAGVSVTDLLPADTTDSTTTGSGSVTIGDDATEAEIVATAKGGMVTTISGGTSGSVTTGDSRVTTTTLEGLEVGANEVTIIVRASNGDLRTYSILVIVPTAGPQLSALTLGISDGAIKSGNQQTLTHVPGPLTGFFGGVYEYTSSLSETVIDDEGGAAAARLTLQITADSGDHLLICRGTTAIIGATTSATIAGGDHREVPAPGQNVDINIYVAEPAHQPATSDAGCAAAETAASSETHTTKYTITAERANALADNADLQVLEVAGASVPDFAPATTEYDASLPFGVTTGAINARAGSREARIVATVAASGRDSDTTIALMGGAACSGVVADGNLDGCSVVGVDHGDTAVVTILVTNGSGTETYTVNITRLPIPTATIATTGPRGILAGSTKERTFTVTLRNIPRQIDNDNDGTFTDVTKAFVGLDLGGGDYDNFGDIGTNPVTDAGNGTQGAVSDQWTLTTPAITGQGPAAVEISDANGTFFRNRFLFDNRDTGAFTLPDVTYEFTLTSKAASMDGEDLTITLSNIGLLSSANGSLFQVNSDGLVFGSPLTYAFVGADRIFAQTRVLDPIAQDIVVGETGTVTLTLPDSVHEALAALSDEDRMNAARLLLTADTSGGDGNAPEAGELTADSMISLQEFDLVSTSAGLNFRGVNPVETVDLHIDVTDDSLPESVTFTVSPQSSDANDDMLVLSVTDAVFRESSSSTDNIGNVITFGDDISGRSISINAIASARATTLASVSVQGQTVRDLSAVGPAATGTGHGVVSIVAATDTPVTVALTLPTAEATNTTAVSGVTDNPGVALTVSDATAPTATLSGFTPGTNLIQIAVSDGTDTRTYAIRVHVINELTVIAALASGQSSTIALDGGTSIFNLSPVGDYPATAGPLDTEVQNLGVTLGFPSAITVAGRVVTTTDYTVTLSATGVTGGVGIGSIIRDPDNTSNAIVYLPTGTTLAPLTVTSTNTAEANFDIDVLSADLVNTRTPIAGADTVEVIGSPLSFSIVDVATAELTRMDDVENLHSTSSDTDVFTIEFTNLIGSETTNTAFVCYTLAGTLDPPADAAEYEVGASSDYAYTFAAGTGATAVAPDTNAECAANGTLAITYANGTTSASVVMTLDPTDAANNFDTLPKTLTMELMAPPAGDGRVLNVSNPAGSGGTLNFPAPSLRLLGADGVTLSTATPAVDVSVGGSAEFTLEVSNYLYNIDAEDGSNDGVLGVELMATGADFPDTYSSSGETSVIGGDYTFGLSATDQANGVRFYRVGTINQIGVLMPKGLFDPNGGEENDPGDESVVITVTANNAQATTIAFAGTTGAFTSLSGSGEASGGIGDADTIPLTNDATDGTIAFLGVVHAVTLALTNDVIVERPAGHSLVPAIYELTIDGVPAASGGGNGTATVSYTLPAGGTSYWRTADLDTPANPVANAITPVTYCAGPPGSNTAAGDTAASGTSIDFDATAVNGTITRYLVFCPNNDNTANANATRTFTITGVAFNDAGTDTDISRDRVIGVGIDRGALSVTVVDDDRPVGSYRRDCTVGSVIRQNDECNFSLASGVVSGAFSARAAGMGIEDIGSRPSRVTSGPYTYSIAGITSRLDGLSTGLTSANNAWIINHIGNVDGGTLTYDIVDNSATASSIRTGTLDAVAGEPDPLGGSADDGIVMFSLTTGNDINTDGAIVFFSLEGTATYPDDYTISVTDEVVGGDAATEVTLPVLRTNRGSFVLPAKTAVDDSNRNLVFTITPLADTMASEGDETVIIRITGVNYTDAGDPDLTLASSPATINIADGPAAAADPAIVRLERSATRLLIDDDAEELWTITVENPASTDPVMIGYEISTTPARAIGTNYLAMVSVGTPASPAHVIGAIGIITITPTVDLTDAVASISIDPLSLLAGDTIALQITSVTGGGLSLANAVQPADGRTVDVLEEATVDLTAAASPVLALEGDANGADITLELVWGNVPNNLDAVVNFSVTPNTATPGNNVSTGDYTVDVEDETFISSESVNARGGSFTFASSDRQTAVIKIVALEESDRDPGETVTVTVTSVQFTGLTDATLGDHLDGVGTDDVFPDPVIVTLGNNDAEATLITTNTGNIEESPTAEDTRTTFAVRVDKVRMPFTDVTITLTLGGNAIYGSAAGGTSPTVHDYKIESGDAAITVPDDVPADGSTGGTLTATFRPAATDDNIITFTVTAYDDEESNNSANGESDSITVALTSVTNGDGDLTRIGATSTTINITDNDRAADFCGRSEMVKVAIIGAITGSPDCGNVLVSQLNALTTPTPLIVSGIANNDADRLKPGDFADLIRVTSLTLTGTQGGDLPDGTFRGLDALTTLDMSGLTSGLANGVLDDVLQTLNTLTGVSAAVASFTEDDASDAPIGGSGAPLTIQILDNAIPTDMRVAVTVVGDQLEHVSLSGPMVDDNDGDGNDATYGFTLLAGQDSITFTVAISDEALAVDGTAMIRLGTIMIPALSDETGVDGPGSLTADALVGVDVGARDHTVTLRLPEITPVFDMATASIGEKNTGEVVITMSLPGTLLAHGNADITFDILPDIVGNQEPASGVDPSPKLATSVDPSTTPPTPTPEEGDYTLVVAPNPGVLEATGNTFTIAAGTNISATFTFKAVDDDRKEGNEVIKIRITEVDFAATATNPDRPGLTVETAVTVTEVGTEDVMKETAMIAHAVGQAQVSMATRLIRQRVSGSISAPRISPQINPQANAHDYSQADPGMQLTLAENPQTIQDFFSQMALESSGDMDDGGNYAVWARGQYVSVSGDPDIAGMANFEYDGTIAGVGSGVERRYENSLVGVSLNYSTADIDSKSDIRAAANYKESMTIVAPYGAWQPQGVDLTLWGTAGYGFGSADISSPDHTTGSPSVSMFFAQAGADHTASFAGNSSIVVGVSALTVSKTVDGYTIDVGPVPELKTDIFQARADATVYMPLTFGESTVRPYFGLASVHDIGDVLASDRHAVEGRIGVSWLKGPWTVDVEGFNQFLREDEKAWGLFGEVSWVGNSDFDGLFMSMTGGHGTASSMSDVAETTNSVSEIDTTLAAADSEVAEWRFGTNTEYGFAAPLLHQDGRATPFFRTTHSADARSFESGVRMDMTNNVGITMETNRHIPADDAPYSEHAVGLEARWAF